MTAMVLVHCREYGVAFCSHRDMRGTLTDERCTVHSVSSCRLYLEIQSDSPWTNKRQRHPHCMPRVMTLESLDVTCDTRCRCAQLHSHGQAAAACSLQQTAADSDQSCEHINVSFNIQHCHDSHDCDTCLAWRCTEATGTPMPGMGLL